MDYQTQSLHLFFLRSSRLLTITEPQSFLRQLVNVRSMDFSTIASQIRVPEI